MIDIKANTDKLLQFVANKFENNELDNNSLVQLIELAGSYLNLQTLPNWAAANGKSYNGAKMQKNKIELFGVKFIIDNF
jgi:hypothetical protein